MSERNGRGNSPGSLGGKGSWDTTSVVTSAMGRAPFGYFLRPSLRINRSLARAAPDPEAALNEGRVEFRDVGRCRHRPGWGLGGEGYAQAGESQIEPTLGPKPSPKPPPPARPELVCLEVI